ncbi:MAG: Ig-like domain-containing protein [Streptosporangiaceae bacterium]
MPPPATVVFNPANGSAGAKPERGIKITAAGGTLENVVANYQGKPIPGEYSGDKLTWKTTWPLAPATSYKITATVKNPEGQQSTVVSKFRTLKPADSLAITDVTPMAGEKVGVGMPIIVRFNRTVVDKKAVEKAMIVKSTKPAVGAWYWSMLDGVQTAIFRPKKFWAANQTVALNARLAGVKAGKGLYGTVNLKKSFRIGDAHIVTISATTHRLTARQNGTVVKTWGVSLGSGGDVQADGVDHLLTTSGVHLTMAHSRLERMRPPNKKKGDPGWYDEKVPFATRISNSGEYIHQNMDDPSCLGNRNCSHGCVRSPSASAEWFMGWSYRGDPVTITGTRRQLDWTNGWGFWQKPWSQWVAGSAAKKPVTT